MRAGLGDPTVRGGVQAVDSAAIRWDGCAPMARNLRRIIACAVSAALLVGAAFGLRAAEASVTDAASISLRRSATQGRDLAGQLVATKLKGLEARATAAASLSQIRALAAQRVDRTTLEDSFSTEAWWAPFRADAAAYQLLLGDPARDFSSLAGLESAPQVAEARARRTASGILPTPSGPMALGAAIVDVPPLGGAAPVLTLAWPLDATFLGPVAEAAHGAVLLTDGRQTLAAAGAPEELAQLRTLVANEREDSFADPAAGWGAAPAVLAPGFRLWVHASGERPDAVPLQAPLTAATLLLVTLSLWLGFRPERDVAELRSAKAQLAEAQLTLSRLTGAGVPGGAAALSAAAGPSVQVGAPAPPGEAPAAPAGPTTLGPSGTALLDGATASPGSTATFGRYRILDRLGEGGMAEVFTAITFGAEGFRRTFVVKRLRAELSRNPAAVSQFIDEARLGASLVHTNIIPVFDFGKVGEEYFLATEYILGRDLHRLTQRAMEVDGVALPPPLAVRAVNEVLSALAYAHTRLDDAGAPLQLVHRDVSPANVLVSARGEVRLFDFGIVKATGRVTQTEHGVVKGNPSLMAPEQARGLAVDQRTDLFSAGLVLYFCLTGGFLYRLGTPYEVLVRAAGGPGPDELARLDALPAPFGSLLRKALSLDPAGRFQDAPEFAAALAQLPMASTTQLAGYIQRLCGAELEADKERLAKAMPAVGVVSA